MYAKLLIAAGIFAAGSLSGWWACDLGADAAMSKVLEEHSAQEAQRATAARTAFQLKILKISEVQDAEHIKRTTAEADARRAIAEHGELRDELAATRDRAARLDFALAADREAARTTISVLTQLLGQCSGRRQELADYADKAAGAGRVCERTYDAVTKEEIP